ncbi:MAG TPA: hypothetical protein VN688_07610, partial [Gemmataceae bacterium]|nr:hypothetical protein [Gemmataceae bacterium]
MEPTSLELSKTPPIPPLREYGQRLDERRRRAAQFSWRERVAGNARVAVFLVGVLLAILALGVHILSAWWVLLPILLYAGLL